MIGISWQILADTAWRQMSSKTYAEKGMLLEEQVWVVWAEKEIRSTEDIKFSSYSLCLSKQTSIFHIKVCMLYLFSTSMTCKDYHLTYSLSQGHYFFLTVSIVSSPALTPLLYLTLCCQPNEQIYQENIFVPPIQHRYLLCATHSSYIHI